MAHVLKGVDVQLRMKHSLCPFTSNKQHPSIRITWSIKGIYIIVYLTLPYGAILIDYWQRVH